MKLTFWKAFWIIVLFELALVAVFVSNCRAQDSAANTYDDFAHLGTCGLVSGCFSLACNPPLTKESGYTYTDTRGALHHIYRYRKNHYDFLPGFLAGTAFEFIDQALHKDSVFNWEHVLFGEIGTFGADIGTGIVVCSWNL